MSEPGGCQSSFKFWCWTQKCKFCIDIFDGVSCNIKHITAISNLHLQWKYSKLIENVYKYSLKHSKDRKGNFPWWDSNPMPLICQTSALTTRPQRIPNLSQITYPSDSCSVMPVTIIYRTSSAHPIHAALQLHICSAHLSGWPTII